MPTNPTTPDQDETLDNISPTKVMNAAHVTGGYPVGKRQLLEIVRILKLPYSLPHGDLDDEFQSVVMREAADKLDMDTVRNIVLTCSNIANAHYLAKALAAMPEKITCNRYHPDTLAFGPETARIGGFNAAIDQYAANLRRVFGEGDHAE